MCTSSCIETSSLVHMHCYRLTAHLLLNRPELLLRTTAWRIVCEAFMCVFVECGHGMNFKKCLFFSLPARNYSNSGKGGGNRPSSGDGRRSCVRVDGLLPLLWVYAGYRHLCPGQMAGRSPTVLDHFVWLWCQLCSGDCIFIALGTELPLLGWTR